LEPDTEIHLRDEQGADIDEEVFPILLEQTVIPDIVFHIDGDIDNQPATVNIDSTSPSQIIYGRQFLDYVKKNRRKM
jgi:hypothetical protein